MPARDSAAAWGSVSRLLHWAMAGLILFQLGFGLYMTRVPDLLARFTLTQTHKSWGFVIFVLALLRIGWRLMNRTRPPLPAAMPRWQVRAARLSHALLYVLMFVMPLSGWVLASASPVQDLLQMQNLVFGRWALPDPCDPRRRRGRGGRPHRSRRRRARPRRAAGAPRRGRAQASVRRPRPRPRPDDPRRMKRAAPRGSAACSDP